MVIIIVPFSMDDLRLIVDFSIAFGVFFIVLVIECIFLLLFFGNDGVHHIEHWFFELLNRHYQSVFLSFKLLLVAGTGVACLVEVRGRLEGFVLHL